MQDNTAAGPLGPGRADARMADLGRRAAGAVRTMAEASDEQVTAALLAMAERLGSERDDIADANGLDVKAAEQEGMSSALQDRLRFGPERIEAMIEQLKVMAATPFPVRQVELRALPGGLRLFERRRPVGVIGANFEARPNVTMDVASQLVKSRNAGVLRTGSAALQSALALHRSVIVPALSSAGLGADAIQLVDEPGREFAGALVRQPGLIRLVILRGSGETTAELAREAARHGVRTLAHAAGGGVLYIDAAADGDVLTRLLREGTDRLGVCNRVNLVLAHESVYDAVLPVIEGVMAEVGVSLSLPPHAHPVGHEWALDSGHEATVTVAPVAGPAQAADVANTETSGLAATVVSQDPEAAAEFLDAYQGTGAFWNATTRLLDGYKLLAVPETGINVDHVPGPRGPVTFSDLYLRQYLVLPADHNLP